MTKIHKKKKKRKKDILFIKIITNEYIPTNMDTYQHKENEIYLEVFKQYLNRILESISLVKISI